MAGVLLTKGQTINGVTIPAGFAVLGLDKDVEAKLTAGGGGSQINLTLTDGSSVSGAWNAATSGTWRPAALGALPRFSVSGGASGGTWALSYRNAAGTVTSDPAETVAAGAVDVSPVFLDDATEIMVTVTGTVTVEVK